MTDVKLTKFRPITPGVDKASFWEHTKVHENGCRTSIAGEPDNPDYHRANQRIAWELTHGPIPVGERPSHWCAAVSCLNPNHLTLIDDPHHQPKEPSMPDRTFGPGEPTMPDSGAVSIPAGGGSRTRTRLQSAVRSAKFNIDMHIKTANDTRIRIELAREHLDVLKKLLDAEPPEPTHEWSETSSDPGLSPATPIGE